MAQQPQTGERRQNQGAQDRPSEGVYDQAREAMSGAADRASEMWDEAVEQGTRYYRDTTRAVSSPDAGTFAMLILGAAVGCNWLGGTRTEVERRSAGA
jgi:hypothetical protein